MSTGSPSRGKTHGVVPLHAPEVRQVEDVVGRADDERVELVLGHERAHALELRVVPRPGHAAILRLGLEDEPEPEDQNGQELEWRAFDVGQIDLDPDLRVVRELGAKALGELSRTVLGRRADGDVTPASSDGLPLLRQALGNVDSQRSGSGSCTTTSQS